MKIYEAKTLIDTMEERSKSYKELREKLEQLITKFTGIINLDDSLQGKGADAIKGFYQGQIDVVEAWLRLVDRHIAFFNSIAGTTENMDLSGNTTIQVPFLDNELSNHEKRNKERVSDQQDELKQIFNRINDIISLDPFSKEKFDDSIEKAEKERKETIKAVEQLDYDLKAEYILSEGEEEYAVKLFQQLIEASRQGNTISPVHFNTEAYQNSEVYKYKHQLEQQTNDYLTYKKGQEELRTYNEEIQANKKTEAELEDLNPFEKSMNSFKEMGNDFWTGLDNRNENKLNSMYDFGNYLTLGAFDGAKASYQGMENRANVTMNSPYDFVNYLSNGTLDLGNGAINPEESFSKEHWYSSLGMASILTGGAGTVVGGVTKPKPSMSKLDNGGKGSLQGVADNIKIKDGKKNEVIEGFKVETREFVSDVVSGGTIFANGVRDGVNRLLNSNYYEKLGLSTNGPSNPWNVFNPRVIQDKIDGVLSKFSLRGNGGKGIVKPVSNMNEFFDMEFGKSISNSLSKSKVKYDGQSIYKVDKKTDNQYLKKGYGVYLDALHKDHLEVIDKTGNVKYVLNLDGTLNPDKTKKALGRVVKGWK